MKLKSFKFHRKVEKSIKNENCEIMSNKCDIYFNQVNQVIYSSVQISIQNMSRHMGKPTNCIGENKDADQLRGNREADQRLCFRYTDSTIPLLLKSKILSF